MKLEPDIFSTKANNWFIKIEEKKKMARCLLAFGLVILVVAGSASRVHAMSCSQAVTTLMPCLPFAVGSDPKPTAPCCLGVKTVNDQATTKEDRRALCECFKKAAPALGVKPEKVKQLPDLCGIKVPVPIDPNIDCNKYSFFDRSLSLTYCFSHDCKQSDLTPCFCGFNPFVVQI